MGRLLYGSAVGLFAVASFSNVALAQGAAQSPSATSSQTASFVPSAPAGLSSCFSVYKFGSITSSFTPSSPEYAQDVTASFTGTIHNQNAYPIDDATLYIKIFNDRTGGQKNINGPDVVASFPAVTHFTLRAGETKNVSFTWHVPPDAVPGLYEAAAYVASSDRFELSGLTFTDDITGSMTRFTVVGQDSGAIRFDKSSVTVAGTPFYFAAFPPTVSSSTVDVPISAAVVNTQPVAATATINWKLYWWDALQQSHLVSQSTQSVTLPPNATTTVTYVAKDTKHDAYYLVGTLTDQYGSSSIIGVRYGYYGAVDDTRLNFVGISAYPAHAGQGEAIACIHSTGGTDVPDTTVTVTARTDNALFPFLSRTIAHASWTGTIGGDIYALTAPFKGSSSSFTVTAKLYRGNSLVDTVTLPYDCKNLNVPCGSSESDILLLALLLIALITVGVLVTRWRVRRHKDPIYG